MKRWLTAVVIIAVLVLILVAAAFLFQKKPASSNTVTVPSLDNNPFADSVDTGTANTAVSPNTFAMNFYKWYVANMEADVNFPTAQQLATSFTAWATPSFILQYQSERGDVNFDEDPVLYSQDVPDGWGSGLTATILSQTDTASSVQVDIGTGSTTQTYTVKLLKGNGQWLINSISSP